MARRKRAQRTLMFLAEMTAEPLTFEAWRQRLYRGRSRVAAKRAWDRLKTALRADKVPFELVEAEGSAVQALRFAPAMLEQMRRDLDRLFRARMRAQADRARIALEAEGQWDDAARERARRARHRRYYRRHREECLHRAAEWAQANLAKVRAAQRKWQAAHRESERDAARARYWADPESARRLARERYHRRKSREER